MADHLLEGATARAQVGARRIETGDGVGTPRLRLRHVRARHLADGEAVLARLQLAREHVDVVLVEANELLVAHDVHVGRRRLQKHLALDIAQNLLLLAHGGLGAVHRVVGAKPGEDRLYQVHTVAARLGHAVEGGARTLVVALESDAGVARDRRPVARLRTRDLLVGAALEGALRIEPRVVPVGGRQRFQQRLCRRMRSGQEQPDNEAGRDHKRRTARAQRCARARRIPDRPLLWQGTPDGSPHYTLQAEPPGQRHPQRPVKRIVSLG